MQAHELRPPKGSKRARKRVGRGNASGHGTYSGRGVKGQKARAGRKPKLGFEGGQTRLIKRLPRRRGFTNIFRKEYSAVNLRDLERFPAGTEVTPELLRQSGGLSTLRRQRPGDRPFDWARDRRWRQRLERAPSSGRSFCRRLTTRSSSRISARSCSSPSPCWWGFASSRTCPYRGST